MRSHDIDDTVRNVGRRVAELRSNAGLTQEQQAERLGFTLKYLQRVEGGGENLTVRSLVKIASVFGVGVTELFRKPRTKQAGPGRPRQRGKTGGKNGPTIDQTAFPNTPATSFWTSSPYAGSSGRAWYVNFYDGYSAFYDVGYSDYGRCVR